MKTIYFLGVEFISPIRYGYLDWLNSVWKRVMLYVFKRPNYRPLSKQFIEFYYPELVSSEKYTTSYDIFINVLKLNGINSFTPEDIKKSAEIMKESMKENIMLIPELCEELSDMYSDSNSDVVLYGNCSLHERDIILGHYPGLFNDTVLSCDIGYNIQDVHCITDYLNSKYKDTVVRVSIFAGTPDENSLGIIDCSDTIGDVRDRQESIAECIHNLRMERCLDAY